MHDASDRALERLVAPRVVPRPLGASRRLRLRRPRVGLLERVGDGLLAFRRVPKRVREPRGLRARVGRGAPDLHELCVERRDVARSRRNFLERPFRLRLKLGPLRLRPPPRLRLRLAPRARVRELLRDARRLGLVAPEVALERVAPRLRVSELPKGVLEPRLRRRVSRVQTRERLRSRLRRVLMPARLRARLSRLELRLRSAIACGVELGANGRELFGQRSALGAFSLVRASGLLSKRLERRVAFPPRARLRARQRLRVPHPPLQVRLSLVPPRAFLLVPRGVALRGLGVRAVRSRVRLRLAARVALAKKRRRDVFQLGRDGGEALRLRRRGVRATPRVRLEALYRPRGRLETRLQIACRLLGGGERRGLRRQTGLRRVDAALERFLFARRAPRDVPRLRRLRRLRLQRRVARRLALGRALERRARVRQLGRQAARLGGHSAHQLAGKANDGDGASGAFVGKSRVRSLRRTAVRQRGVREHLARGRGRRERRRPGGVDLLRAPRRRPSAAATTMMRELANLRARGADGGDERRRDARARRLRRAVERRDDAVGAASGGRGG